MKSLFVSGALLGLLAGCSAVDDEPSAVDTREGEGGNGCGGVVGKC